MPKRAAVKSPPTGKRKSSRTEPERTPSEAVTRFRPTSRNEAQKKYLSTIQKNLISFGIGSAGTGKTLLAVAAAVEALQNRDVRRIILIRPCVEAGEKLGFLPGGVADKLDPYLRPLYDALQSMLGPTTLKALLENNTIEIAPLAFLRGRTLSDAFIIADECQNSTMEQMRMLVSRFGDGSKMVITGDPEQVDLPKHVLNGLQYAEQAFSDVDGVGFLHFEASDVVRHPIVSRLIHAHNEWDEQRPSRRP